MVPEQAGLGFLENRAGVKSEISNAPGLDSGCWARAIGVFLGGQTHTGWAGGGNHCVSHADLGSDS